METKHHTLTFFEFSFQLNPFSTTEPHSSVISIQLQHAWFGIHWQVVVVVAQVGQQSGLHTLLVPSRLELLHQFVPLSRLHLEKRKKNQINYNTRITAFQLFLFSIKKNKGNKHFFIIFSRLLSFFVHLGLIIEGNIYHGLD